MPGQTQPTDERAAEMARCRRNALLMGIPIFLVIVAIGLLALLQGGFSAGLLIVAAIILGFALAVQFIVPALQNWEFKGQERLYRRRLAIAEAILIGIFLVIYLYTQRG